MEIEDQTVAKRERKKKRKRKRVERTGGGQLSKNMTWKILQKCSREKEKKKKATRGGGSKRPPPLFFYRRDVRHVDSEFVSALDNAA